MESWELLSLRMYLLRLEDTDGHLLYYFEIVREAPVKCNTWHKYAFTVRVRAEATVRVRAAATVSTPSSILIEDLMATLSPPLIDESIPLCIYCRINQNHKRHL